MVEIALMLAFLALACIAAITSLCNAVPAFFRRRNRTSVIGSASAHLAKGVFP